jgi:hypothetical protein
VTTRAEIHQIVDSLPEGQLAAAAPLADPVLAAFLNAPIDDEPLSEEDEAAIAEGQAAIARGEVERWEKVRAQLGLG